MTTFTQTLPADARACSDCFALEQRDCPCSSLGHMTRAHRITMALVNRGIFTIDDEGHVWRNHVMRNNGSTVPVDRRRADRLHPTGYLYVRSRVMHVSGDVPSHRLVWIADGRNIPSGYHINHINGVRTDNRLSNLEAVTPLENVRHAIRNFGRKSRAGEQNAAAKLTTDAVREIRRRSAAGEPGWLLASDFGVDRTTVSKVINRHIWRCALEDVR